MPKSDKVQGHVPNVRRTSLGSTCAELGAYRIVLHDKKYTASQSKNGWHRENYLGGRGWVICDHIPGPIEAALRHALQL